MNARSPSSFVITSTSPTDCAPICSPNDAPVIVMNAGPFHVPLGFLMNTSPSPTWPPTMNPAFVTEGNIATPFPDFMTSASESASLFSAISFIRFVAILILFSWAFSAKLAVAKDSTIMNVASIVAISFFFIFFPPFGCVSVLFISHFCCLKKCFSLIFVYNSFV